MWCYISLPHQQCIEIEIDIKQTGRVILDKVLERLGVLEVDYFGLQYSGSKNEALWLNLRNRMCDHEITGATRVYRLSLRVKFFVPPHSIQQESTKELFYNQVKDMMAKGLISLDSKDCSDERLARIVACVCQAEHGDQTGNVYQNTLYQEIYQSICACGQDPRDPSVAFLELVSTEHSKIRGATRSSASYLLLTEVSSLASYGREVHRATSDSGSDTKIAVGPEGIIIQNCKTCKSKSIPYTQIRLATHIEKSVHISLSDDFGQPQCEKVFKLRSKKSAGALYRCITEMHSFYRCDTVDTNVQSQYCRDLKGTFVSIFNENSDLGKRYIFDIQRTRQEAYDLVRRKLYAKLNSPLGSPVHGSTFPMCGAHSRSDSDEEEDEEEELDVHRCDGVSEMNGNEAMGCPAPDVEKLVRKLNKNQEKKVKQLKRRIEHLEDSFTCCVCLDRQVNVVLCPCGHMTCDDCANRIDQCPQCRTRVERYQKVFTNAHISSREKVSKEYGKVA